MDNDININKPQIENNFKNQSNKSNQRKLIYLLIFLFTLHFTPATYIESTFLKSLISDDKISLIYSLASTITIIGLFYAKKVIRTKGNFKTFFSVLIIEFISLGILSLSIFADKNTISNYILIIAFIMGFVSRSIAFLNFDIFLEHLSKDSSTGSIRGNFLTSLNFAFVIGPVIGGLISNNTNDIWKVFFLGILLLIPVIYLSLIYFKDFKDAEYRKFPIESTLLYIIKNKDLRNIFICNFILFFFYSWMIIYTPIFLKEVIGFNLTQVGLIIGIALLPFLFLQYYLGRIADHKYGEKEILTLGLIVMGLSTILMSIFSVKVFSLWAGILFITRIGASMVETMVETYIFKKVDDQNLDVISFYRATRPIAYIFSPLIALSILGYADMKILFLILGIIIISGIFFSLNIKDTK